MKAIPFIMLGAASVVSMFVACGTDAPVAGLKPSVLRITGPNNLSWPAGLKFPVPMTVRLETAEGAAIPGVNVLWKVASGGGIVGAEDFPGHELVGSVITLRSDSDGYSSVIWTLGPQLGEQSVTASVSGFAGSPAAFLATATPP